MTELLFSGVVSMRRDTLGLTDIQNEHYTGWAPSKDAAWGAWARHAMAKHPGYSVSWQAVYDITDIALQRLAPKDQHATNRVDASGEAREPGFYWVLPIFDVDGDADSWHQKHQPAYWDGVTWHMLGVEDEAWRPKWVGERIAPMDGGR